MTFAIHPGSIRQAFDDACRRLDRTRFIEAIWARRLDVWTSDARTQQQIGDRLGWLDAAERVAPDLPRVRALAGAVSREGVTDVVLLGMGGSSLAAEVLRAVAGNPPGAPRFHVLDSVDPDAVRAAMARPSSSLFIVASKSGSTVEVASFAAEAEARVRGAGIAAYGSRFLAITDPGSPLQQLARERGYRDTFVNPADIGGRYSALSLFGLVPAALMGIDIDALIAPGAAMAEACRSTDVRVNPGAALGALMAAAAMHGRDKLSLVLPDRLQRLGLWIEQLVAESTGKDGKGIVPIVESASATERGRDRLPVQCTDTTEPASGSAPTSGHSTDVPRVMVATRSSLLGAEFFRWEFATATAGFLLDVNPFDEPNVRQAKDATRALLAVHQTQGRLPAPAPDTTIDGATLSLSRAAKAALGSQGPLAFLDVLSAGDYFGLLAYLPPEDKYLHPLLIRLCEAVGERTGCATSLGYGPRYLHSTGQLHKGGPNSGVFLLLTADPASDLQIPGQAYSFGVLELAQAAGDFSALDEGGRRVLRIHLPSRDSVLLERLAGRLLRGA